MLEEKDLEKMIEEYLITNLRIDKKEFGSNYGSRPYIEIQLKLGEKEISSIYVDL
jgi:hypothetical protein